MVIDKENTRNVQFYELKTGVNPGKRRSEFLACATLTKPRFLERSGKNYVAANVLRLAPVAGFITEPNKYTGKSKDLTHSEGIKFSHRRLLKKPKPSHWCKPLLAAAFLKAKNFGYRQRKHKKCPIL